MYFLGFIYNTSDSPPAATPIITATGSNYTLTFSGASRYVSAQTQLASSVTLSTTTALITAKWFTIY